MHYPAPFAPVCAGGLVAATITCRCCGRMLPPCLGRFPPVFMARPRVKREERRIPAGRVAWLRASSHALHSPCRAAVTTVVSGGRSWQQSWALAAIAGCGCGLYRFTGACICTIMNGARVLRALTFGISFRSLLWEQSGWENSGLALKTRSSGC